MQGSCYYEMHDNVCAIGCTIRFNVPWARKVSTGRQFLHLVVPRLICPWPGMPENGYLAPDGPKRLNTMYDNTQRSLKFILHIVTATINTVFSQSKIQDTCMTEGRAWLGGAYDHIKGFGSLPFLH